MFQIAVWIQYKHWIYSKLDSVSGNNPNFHDVDHFAGHDFIMHTAQSYNIKTNVNNSIHQKIYILYTLTVAEVLCEWLHYNWFYFIFSEVQNSHHLIHFLPIFFAALLWLNITFLHLCNGTLECFVVDMYPSSGSMKIMGSSC